MSISVASVLLCQLLDFLLYQPNYVVTLLFVKSCSLGCYFVFYFYFQIDMVGSQMNHQN